MPKSTLGNWMNEFRRFCPVIRTIKFHGKQDERVRTSCAFDTCVLAVLLQRAVAVARVAIELPNSNLSTSQDKHITAVTAAE